MTRREKDARAAAVGAAAADRLTDRPTDVQLCKCAGSAVDSGQGEENLGQILTGRPTRTYGIRPMKIQVGKKRKKKKKKILIGWVILQTTSSTTQQRTSKQTNVRQIVKYRSREKKKKNNATGGVPQGRLRAVGNENEE
ncbi:hypothetical protein Tsp_13138 [Trichinella spiralis]|uniref:hypothetical protein n=1 Tax=Trichinella spiralis TaxID=6334 RepID=UPI0001EFE061|nr:hypothetical protein Tsp_13138 [Trichinella spiralis]